MDKVFERVVNLIEIVDKEEQLTGEQKKHHVLNVIESSIKCLDTFENSNYKEVGDAVPLLIDLIVFLSKNKKLLKNINRARKKICYCIYQKNQ